MKVTVINGSPKGKNSITLKYIEYIEKRNPADEFSIIHAGQKIRSFSRIDAMNEVMQTIIDSDLLIFSYPVYTFLVPYQLAKFIELMKEHPEASKLKDGFVTQLSTSLHFYDVTAHRYIIENSLDLGMKVIEGHSAEMEDLLSEKGRKQLSDFYKRINFAVDNNITAYVTANKPSGFNFIFQSETTVENIQDSPANAETVIVTDCESDTALMNMINEFINIYPRPVKIVNIGEFRFLGGCMGCFRCATTGNCIYKDGFQDLLRNEIQTMRAIIYAFAVKDHSLGTTFKQYHDRQFCNGHRTVIRGVYSGYIVHGELYNERNLLDVMEARADVSETHIAGIACDESCDQTETAAALKNLSTNLDFALTEKWEKASTFFGIGGMKIFRDLIFVMRGLMKADHKFYKKHGIYDFPHKRRGRIIQMQLVGLLMSIPAVRRKAGNRMTEAMLKPYKDVI